jgi:hypothetical protein
MRQIRKDNIRFKINVDLSYLKFKDGVNKFVLKQTNKNKTYEEV